MRAMIATAVLLAAGAAAAGEKGEHVCGEGPHTVRVRLLEDRETCHVPPPSLRWDDTYVEREPECRKEPRYEDQEWSDWPECPGAERTCLSCTTSGLITWDGDNTLYIPGAAR